MAAKSDQAPVITVITAQALTASQVQQVKTLLHDRVGESTVIFQTDPDILGGIQVKIGEQRFDASLEGQLRRLQLTQDRCLVTTAVPLTASQRTELTKAITQKHGSMVIDEEVDPRVIGGIKIVIGSKEYDHTLAGRLAQLKKQAHSTL